MPRLFINGLAEIGLGDAGDTRRADAGSHIIERRGRIVTVVILRLVHASNIMEVVAVRSGRIEQLVETTIGIAETFTVNTIP